MICISVTPSSRTLAPADLLNASRKADMIELCLDNFIKTPDVGDLLKLTDKPILISCRTRKEGGQFEGSEEERLNLLRQAIVAGPEYVELDLSIADDVPRFGGTKRVISYTSLNRPINNIDEIFERCWKAKADVVKVTWPTEDLDAAWPLLAAVSKARELPVVGQGIGPSGLTFSLLARRYGSPWIYAALERGMEAFEGEPSVWQLQEEYGFDDIGKGTRFIGVIGLGAAENTTVRVFNAAFQSLNRKIRCLPLVPGSLDRLKKRLAVMKINALVVDPLWSGDLNAMCVNGGEGARFIDLMMESSSGWKGKATLFDAVESVILEHKQDERWASGRATTVFGTSPLALAAANWMSAHKAAVSLAGPSDNAAMAVAKKADVRHLQWAAVHANVTDVIVVTGGEIKCGTGRRELNPSLIREHSLVIDLTEYPGESAFAEEARARGAIYISPASVFAAQMQRQFRALTNLDLPADAIAKGLKE